MSGVVATNGRVVAGAGVELHYELRGDGPPVVLVGGLGDDVGSWEPVASLADDHLVLAFDNRGVGQSSVPPGPYSMEAMADDAHAVVEELGLRGATAIGFSMGGAICQRWALRHPDDVSRLVLTNTWGGDPDPGMETLIESWCSLARRGAGRELLANIAAACFSAEFLAAAGPDALEEYVSMEPPPTEGFVAAAAAFLAHDTRAEAASIRQPALVIVGDRDRVTSPALGALLAGRLADGELAQLPTGHAGYWERPREWLALVRDFMSRGSAG